MFNVAIGIVWQCCLTIVPMYLVVRGTGGLIASVLLLVVTTVVLKYNLVQAVVQGREGI